jgi:hypothetical protein
VQKALLKILQNEFLIKTFKGNKEGLGDYLNGITLGEES